MYFLLYLEDSCTLTVTQVSDVLRFLAELCREVEVKDWLGSVQNSLFWPPLLNLLCTMPHHLSGVHHSHTNKVTLDLDGLLGLIVFFKLALFLL